MSDTPSTTVWSRIRSIFGGIKPQDGPGAAFRTDGTSIRNIPSWIIDRDNYMQGDKIVVTEKTAQTISPVWAAVRVITSAVSILPIKVYKWDNNNSREEVEDREWPARIAQNPNDDMTAATFWETMMAHVLLWGNCYAEIERNIYGDPVAMWVIPPNCIAPNRTEDGDLYYELAHEYLGQKTLLPSDVFHVPGLGWDGTEGYSVVTMARRSLELTAGYETAAYSFAESGMRPSGALKYPHGLDKLQKGAKANEINLEHAGVKKFGKVLLLYGGMEWQQLGIPQGDAQFLETRRFQVDEVCRWFNVPQHMLREMERSTNNNIEHQGQEFVTYTLVYWLTKITQEFKRKIIGNRRMYAEHVVDSLVRGDLKSRYDALGRAVQSGFMTPNEARRLENRPPVDGGDKLLVPVNLRPVDAPWEGKGTAKPQTATQVVPEDEELDDMDEDDSEIDTTEDDSELDTENNDS